MDGGKNYNDYCNDDIFTDDIFISGTSTPFDVGRNAGDCDCTSGNGGGQRPPGSVIMSDPVNTGTGNKFEQETDYEAPDGFLTFRRFYNSVISAAITPRPLGQPWGHSFQRDLEFDGSSAVTYFLQANRPDGHAIQFHWNDTNKYWYADADVQDTLASTKDSNGKFTSFTLTLAAVQQVETYFGDGRLDQVRDLKSGELIYGTTYSDATTPPTIAPKPNLLIGVTDVNGRSIHFTYDVKARLQSMTSPDGRTVTYGYDSDTGPLSSVTYPDGAVRRYLYNEADRNGGVSQPGALTGTIDEHGTRFDSTSYDAKGRVTQTSKPGGADALALAYASDGSNITTMTGPLGASTGLKIGTTWFGLKQIYQTSLPCGPLCEQPWQVSSFDNNGNRASSTDFNGHTTNTTYDAHNLLTQSVEAVGTAQQRTIDTTWDGAGRVPLTQTKKDAHGTIVQSQAWAYNERHQVTASCDIDPSINTTYACGSQPDAPSGVSQTRYTYCDALDSSQCPHVGLLLSIDGPRTDVADVVTNRYYVTTDESGCGTATGPCQRAGDLNTVTDALGHVSTVVSYDKAGRVVRRRDIHGVIKDVVYNSRGWITQATVRANADGSPSSADATTLLEYDVSGLLHKVTDPDGVTLTYGYDDAHRLVDIQDGAGDHIHYTLDAAGDHVREEVFDATGAVTWSLSRIYNPLAQLIRVVDGRGEVVFDASAANDYDGAGNLVHFVGANGVEHSDVYDALNRMASSVSDFNGTNASTANATNKFSIDALDRLTGFIDPEGLTTTYGFDGLGHPTSLISPDTGSSGDTVDVAGNILTTTNAKGITATYAYDALSRRTAATYADTTLNIAYHYDEANGITGCTASYPAGRLTRIVEAVVTTTYCYDNQGRVSEKRQTQGDVTDTTGYTYTRAGRLLAIAMPSGAIITYGHNALGQIASITATPFNGSATPIVSGVSYLPFGPVLSYTFGNGQDVVRAYDANYQPTDVNSANFSVHYDRDAAGRIVGLSDASSAGNPETYVYDSLDRLTAIQSTTFNESYTYNKTGDRLSKTSNAQAAGARGTYSYQPGSHILASISGDPITFDANGSLIHSQTQANSVEHTYLYDERGRMTEAQDHGVVQATFAYNAFDQRVSKSGFPGLDQRFVYDEGGQLIGDYGVLSHDYIWMGGLPVGVLDDAVPVYIIADGMGTPRRADVGDGSGNYWQWLPTKNPFGEGTSYFGGYQLNLRYPGQYFDTETPFIYNGHRYYDPHTGRYVQSDPIGLAGGTSTYAYADGNPLNSIDPLGLSTVTYDAQSHTVTYIRSDGTVAGTFPANNVTTRTSNGAWPNGAFNRVGSRPHPESDANGAYGSHGIIIFDVPGRTGMGLHSGRADRGAQNHPTLGCIRTTDDAMGFVRDLDRVDPIISINVVNNDPNAVRQGVQQ